ncbi:hypothetical protein HYU17_02170 [Candidatus Woesearchaeota archaeon]|nr:hypothetical protein [Candidatus Woesearchaeota archaeon]
MERVKAFCITECLPKPKSNIDPSTVSSTINIPPYGVLTLTRIGVRSLQDYWIWGKELIFPYMDGRVYEGVASSYRLSEQLEGKPIPTRTPHYYLRAHLSGEQRKLDERFRLNVFLPEIREPYFSGDRYHPLVSCRILSEFSTKNEARYTGGLLTLPDDPAITGGLEISIEPFPYAEWIGYRWAAEESDCLIPFFLLDALTSREYPPEVMEGHLERLVNLWKSREVPGISSFDDLKKRREGVRE